MSKSKSPAKNFKMGTVAILGRPNAGKSTLLNALLESPLSAVSKRPQTTRSNIRGILQKHDKGAWTGQLLVIDTPGLNFKKGLIERSLYSAIEGALKEVDLNLWVSDVKTFHRDLLDMEKNRPGSDKIPAWIKHRLETQKEGRWFLVLNKVDTLSNTNELLPLMERIQKAGLNFEAIIPISAMLGMKDNRSNLKTLVDVLFDKAPEGTPIFSEEDWTTLSEKALVQNLIREAVFRQCREELPYETDASIASFEEPESAKKRPLVNATLWVAKPSLKPILVGAQGSRIKEIGIAVRARYKEITNQDLIIKLFVKVVEKWNKDPHFLEELGYANS